MTAGVCIDTAYALFLIAVAVLGGSTWMRHASARRRLMAVEAASPRAGRGAR